MRFTGSRLDMQRQQEITLLQSQAQSRQSHPCSQERGLDSTSCQRDFILNSPGNCSGHLCLLVVFIQRGNTFLVLLPQEVELQLGPRCSLGVRLTFEKEGSQVFETKHSWIVKQAKVHLVFKNIYINLKKGKEFTSF